MRRLVPAAVVLFSLVSLGCSGWLTPRVLHELQVDSDVCGNFEVTVDAEAGGRALDLLVDGEVVETFRVDGRQVFHWLGSGAPGSAHTVSARFSSKNAQTASVTVLPVDNAVTLEAATPYLYAGHGDQLLLSVSDACAPSVAPSWEVRVGTETLTGSMLPSARTVAIPLPDGLVAGEVTAYSRVTLSPYNTESDAVRLFLDPPCADDDGDGLSTCDGDCDDGDATIGTCAPSDDRDGDGVLHPSAGGTDCNDAHSSVHPGAVDVVDADGDGFGVLDGRDDDCDGVVDNGLQRGDCDDSNARVSPGLAEQPSPNGLDDNCDGRIDEGTRVYDDDGDGYSEDEGDCNDADASMSPASPELADCRDNNCNQLIDEGVEPVAVDDSYEANDTQETATSLSTRRNRFTQSLELVTRDANDEEWFHFWSSDGPFDSWGINATMTQGPEQSRIELVLRNSSGAVMSRRTVTGDGQAVSLSGRGMSNDSGYYYLQVRSLVQPHDYCPVTIRLTGR